jgi:hypothetical protein
VARDRAPEAARAADVSPAAYFRGMTRARSRVRELESQIRELDRLISALDRRYPARWSADR